MIQGLFNVQQEFVQHKTKASSLDDETKTRTKKPKVRCSLRGTGKHLAICWLMARVLWGCRWAQVCCVRLQPGRWLIGLSHLQKHKENKPPEPWQKGCLAAFHVTVFSSWQVLWDFIETCGIFSTKALFPSLWGTVFTEPSLVAGTEILMRCYENSDLRPGNKA